MYFKHVYQSLVYCFYCIISRVLLLLLFWGDLVLSQLWKSIWRQERIKTCKSEDQVLHFKTLFLYKFDFWFFITSTLLALLSQCSRNHLFFYSLVVNPIVMLIVVNHLPHFHSFISEGLRTTTARRLRDWRICNSSLLSMQFVIFFHSSFEPKGYIPLQRRVASTYQMHIFFSIFL